jgi:hypothetical protein
MERPSKRPAIVTHTINRRPIRFGRHDLPNVGTISAAWFSLNESLDADPVRKPKIGIQVTSVKSSC